MKAKLWIAGAASVLTFASVPVHAKGLCDVHHLGYTKNQCDQCTNMTWSVSRVFPAGACVATTAPTPTPVPAPTPAGDEQGPRAPGSHEDGLRRPPPGVHQNPVRPVHEHDLERQSGVSAGSMRFHRPASDHHERRRQQGTHADAGRPLVHAHELGRSDAAARRAEFQRNGSAHQRVLEGLRPREVAAPLLDRCSRDGVQRAHHERDVQQDDRGARLQPSGHDQREALLPQLTRRGGRRTASIVQSSASSRDPQWPTIFS